MRIPSSSFGLRAHGRTVEKAAAAEMGSNSLGVSGASSGSSDTLHGLKFGKKIYFEDGSGGGGGSSSKAHAAAAPPPPPAAEPPPQPAKKGKGMAQGGQQQPPRCQVEGCKVDLTGAKAYYCRHKVCGMHSKAPKVIVAGLEQRFCQQCSRFHQLLEFDQGKRSCRRRLAGHNERRRKPPAGPFASRYGRDTSSFHEPSRYRCFVMDFGYPRFSTAARDVWPTIRPVDRASANQSLGVLYRPGAAVVHGAHRYVQGASDGRLYSVPELPQGECRAGVSDASCALSLLSTQPWNTSSLRNQASTFSANGSFDGTSVSQRAISNNCMTNSWGFIGQVGRTSSRVAEVSDGQFSGELELALQGSDHGSSRAAEYEQTGNAMRWSP